MGGTEFSLWHVLVLACCAAPLLALLDRGGTRRRAEKQVYRLVEAGWAPSPQVHAAAVRQVVQEQRVSYLTASAGVLIGVLVMILTGQPAERLGWGFSLGMVIGLYAGRIVVHLRAGRLRVGPRVVLLRRRRAWDYLPPEDRAAVKIHLGVVLATVLLTAVGLAEAGGAADPAPLLLVGGAIAWCLVALVGAQLVARAAMAARTRDALGWQDAWRSVAVRDLMQLTFIASWLAVSGLWVATSEWPALAWADSVVVVGFAAILLGMVLPTFGRPVIEPADALTQDA